MPKLSLHFDLAEILSLDTSEKYKQWENQSQEDGGELWRI